MNIKGLVMLLLHQMSQRSKQRDFGAENKQDLTKMNLNPLLGQGKIIREIIAHDLIFWNFYQ